MDEKELRQAIRELPPMEPSSTYPRFTWERRRAELRERILGFDPSLFLTWPMIHEALFVGDSPHANMELEELRNDGWWRWQRGIREVTFGAPARMKAWQDTSGQMVHQAYILKQWEDRTGKRIEDIQTLFEFGGGYGSMARLCKQLGFEGVHVIFDLPEFGLLQQYYTSQASSRPPLVFTFSDVEWFKRVASCITYDLFIAACSLSEVPLELRDQILGMVKARAYVILYQTHFQGLENGPYFERFAESKPGYEWVDYAVPKHRLGHRYLVGVQK